MRKRGSKWILGVILLAGCLLYGQMTVSAKEQEPMTVETTRRQAKATGARLNFTNVKKEFNVLDYGASVTSKNNYRAFQKTIDEAHKYQQKQLLIRMKAYQRQPWQYQTCLKLHMMHKL